MREPNIDRDFVSLDRSGWSRDAHRIIQSLVRTRPDALVGLHPETLVREMKNFEDRGVAPHELADVLGHAAYVLDVWRSWNGLPPLCDPTTSSTTTA